MSVLARGRLGMSRTVYSVGVLEANSLCILKSESGVPKDEDTFAG